MELSEYAAVGDPDGEHVLTAADRRRQRRAVQLQEDVADLMRRCPPPAEVPTDVVELIKATRAGHRLHPQPLMRWRLRLYCGHVIETTAHVERLNYIDAIDSKECPDCGMDPAAVVATRPLGVAAPRR